MEWRRATHIKSYHHWSAVLIVADGNPQTAKIDTKRPQSAGLNRASVSNMNRRYLFWCVAAIFAGLLGLVTFFLATFEDPAVDPAWALRSETEIPEGSESTANIGCDWGLEEDQIRIAVDRQPVRVERFTITLIATQHFELPNPAVAARALSDPDITEPLVPPVGAFEYRVGQPDAIHVSHPRGRWLIQGSAGYMEGGLSGSNADVVFLGIGGVGTQTKEYREADWHQTVTTIGATRVIPIHWDSLTGPTEGPFTGTIRVAALLTNDGTPLTLEFLKQQESNHAELQFPTLPRFDEIVLF